jgi:hypothetical protein
MHTTVDKSNGGERANVNLWLERDLRDEIADLAKRNYRTLTAEIRFALARHIEREREAA